MLALMLCFMAILVNVQQPQAWANTVSRGEHPLVGDLKSKLVDTRAVPITVGQFSERSDRLQWKTPLSGQIPCSDLMAAVRQAKQRVERDQRIATSGDDPKRQSVMKTVNPLVFYWQQYDLKILEHNESELNKCLAARDNATVELRPEKNCPISQFLSFRVAYDGGGGHDIPIWRQPGSYAVFYESGLNV